SEVLQQVVVKTDGVPLFVEELTKMVLESGLLREQGNYYKLTGSLPQLTIPATLQDSFMARLDRVDTGEICGLGATLGREFTYDLLQAVSALDEETLKRELAKLVESELLYQRGHPPQATYIFKHALIQDAAYQSLLRGKRQQYHQKIAEVLEKHFPETAETQPELLAHHYTEAGLIEKAIPFWQAAGQRAIERSANVEAIGHLNKGLNLIKTQPESPERTQQELDLLITLGPALTATKGFAASEVEKTYALAMELCRKVEKTPQLFPVLWGQWAFYAARADHKTVRELSEQLLLLAQDQQGSGLLVEAHSAVGASLFWLGELIPARDHLEQGIALYGPRQHRSHAFIYGQDPGVFCLSYLARALWFLGYPDQALDRINETLSMAQELSHPFSLAFALYFATLIRQLRQEVQSVRELTEKVITLSSEQGFPQWLTYGTILQGWMLADKGQGEGIAQVRQGMADWRTTGAEIGRPHHLGLLIETYLKVGEAEEGLTSIAEALAVVNKNGELYYEAELYRLKGELLLKLGDAESEACFLKAIDIARRQGAKSLELRAVTSLSRLLQKQGKKDEARQMLSEIYDWFTEGFDTKDLLDAKTLLEELS
ncbi:tetratricopeptide repeat protein, partial [Desulfobacterota bacterium AH_259_B03_O07]|nr:tetratricopeptide repeat protein [Desulfobacterota bacterium AH_259_B03_O07]